MKKSSITNAKNRLSALIDQVQQGDSVLIVDRGRPVARLSPVAGNELDAHGRLSRLERQGVANRPAAAPPVKLIADPPPRARASALAALLTERSAGR